MKAGNVSPEDIPASQVIEDLEYMELEAKYLHKKPEVPKLNKQGK